MRLRQIIRMRRSHEYCNSCENRRLLFLLLRRRHSRPQSNSSSLTAAQQVLQAYGILMGPIPARGNNNIANNNNVANNNAAAGLGISTHVLDSDNKY
mmetsp:Transcript_33275/g.56568  ORF Transcript_33275/g.56568 Transcript_33275/m.56568 type:complete len:97 (+) Transcript_33275:192-482(+)